MSKEPELMTIAEAAKFLRIPEPTAYYLAGRGKLPGAFRIGGRWRVRRSVLAQIIPTVTEQKPVRENGTADNPVQCTGFDEAADCAVERDRPIYATVSGQIFKVFPSRQFELVAP